MKEAYTKALGLGLGFDFKRISFDLRDNQLSVDQRLVTGWGLWMLELSDGYQCCIARSGTGDETNKVQKTLTDVEYIDIYEIVNSLSR
jgi:phosphopantetheinyl transferase